MSELCALSVKPAFFDGRFTFPQALSLGTGRKSESAFSIAIWERGKIARKEFPKFFRFSPNSYHNGSSEGIAVNPSDMYLKFGEAAICFSGQIENKDNLLDWFINQGYVFSMPDDNVIVEELLAAMMARGDDIVEGMRTVLRDASGQYQFLVLASGKVYAASSGMQLHKGSSDKGFILSSREDAFEGLGFEPAGALASGEIACIEKGGV